MKGHLMYLQEISDLAEFLSQKSHSPEEVLVHLALRTFAPLSCTGVVMSELKANGIAEITAQYGLEDDFFESHPKRFRLSELMPISAAIKDQGTVWVNTLPKWGDEFEMFKDISYEYDAQTFIAFPIEKSGTPYAAMGLFCLDVLDPNPEIEEFLGVIASLLALFFYSNRDGFRYGFDNQKLFDREELLKSKDLRGSALTERQLLILRMIAEGRTNLAISNALGYSESTIRHETIKIYAKLGCTGRFEASNIYQSSYAKSDQELSGTRP